MATQHTIVNDPTPFKGGEEWSDYLNCRDGDNGDLGSWAFVCHLVYPTRGLRDLAIRQGVLGKHEGNVEIVFMQGGETISPLYFRPNSDCVHEDMNGAHQSYLDRLRPIPAEMAANIHPAAFLQLFRDVEQSLRDGYVTPEEVTHITETGDYRTWLRRAEWNERKGQMDALPGMDVPPPAWHPQGACLGNGTPLTEAHMGTYEEPQEYVNPEVYSKELIPVTRATHILILTPLKGEPNVFTDSEGDVWNRWQAAFRPGFVTQCMIEHRLLAAGEVVFERDYDGASVSAGRVLIEG